MKRAKVNMWSWNWFGNWARTTFCNINVVPATMVLNRSNGVQWKYWFGNKLLRVLYRAYGGGRSSTDHEGLVRKAVEALV